MCIYCKEIQKAESEVYGETNVSSIVYFKTKINDSSFTVAKLKNQIVYRHTDEGLATLLNKWYLVFDDIFKPTAEYLEFPISYCPWCSRKLKETTL